MPKSKKVCHLIGDATCEKTERLKYNAFAEDEEFAKREGFVDVIEMQNWFGDPAVYGDEEWKVIHYKLLPKPLCEMIYQLAEILEVYEEFKLEQHDLYYNVMHPPHKFWQGYQKALLDVSKEMFPNEPASARQNH